MIWLVAVQARGSDTGSTAGVSIWVQADGEDQALSRARTALAEQGWEWLELDALAPTDAGDYFRECESFQAFQRADEEGIAFRFPE